MSGSVSMGALREGCADCGKDAGVPVAPGEASVTLADGRRPVVHIRQRDNRLTIALYEEALWGVDLERASSVGS